MVLFQRSCVSPYEVTRLTRDIPQTEEGPSWPRNWEQLHPEDIDAVKQCLQEAVASAAEYAVRYRLPDPAGGEPVWVLERGWKVSQEPAHLEGFMFIGMQQAEGASPTLPPASRLPHPAAMSFLLRAGGGAIPCPPFPLAGAPPGLAETIERLLGQWNQATDMPQWSSALAEAQGGETIKFELTLRSHPTSPDLECTLQPVPQLPDWELPPEAGSGDDLDNFELLFHSSSSPMLVVREDVVVRCNKAATDLFGTNFERDLLGRRPGSFLHRTEEEQPNTAACEHEMIRLDGQRLTVDVTTTALPLDNREHSLYVLYDLSEQKRIQEALRVSIERAEQANKAKSVFLATMSHEIRTPMNIILGFLALAQHTSSTVKLLDYVQKVETAAQSLLRIINDILDVSKIEAGQVSLEQEDFSVEQTLEELVQTAAVWNRSNPEVELVLELDPELPPQLSGDALRLKQVLLNLVSNAFKFTASGAVVISVRKVAASATDVRLEFAVQDTGIGLTEEQISRLFSPFVQADSSVTRRYGGTGLGLFICRSLTELLGGELNVQSELGRGSRFTFTVRLDLPKAEQQRTPNESSLGRLRVLLADDNQVSLSALRTTLQQFGYAVTAVTSGSEALEEAHSATERFDLVLLDSSMPDMSGIETLERMQLDPGFGREVMMLLTSSPDEELITRALKAGFRAVIPKPLSQSTLHDELVQAFGGRRNVRKSVARARRTGAPLKQFEPSRILLAEDHEMNQELATEMLRLRGLQCKIARNGYEALADLEKQVFDLVLMDVQMPGLDGLEATRQARRMGVHAPIVALTANAMPEDNERCLAAGMNDYIPKPIEPEHLDRVLSRFLQPRGTPAPRRAEPEDEAAEPELPQMPGIDFARGLRRLGGHWKIFSTMLDQFVAKQANVPMRISAQLHEGDYEGACRTAHSLRGVAGSLGAIDLAETARQLEMRLRQKAERSQLEGLLATLGRDMARVSEAVQKMSGAVPEPEDAGGPLNPEEVLDKVRRIESMLTRDVAESLALADELVSRGLESSVGDRLRQVHLALHEFDIDGAGELLRNLLAQLETSRPGGGLAQE